MDLTYLFEFLLKYGFVIATIGTVILYCICIPKYREHNLSKTKIPKKVYLLNFVLGNIIFLLHVVPIEIIAYHFSIIMLYTYFIIMLLPLLFLEGTLLVYKDHHKLFKGSDKYKIDDIQFKKETIVIVQTTLIIISIVVYVLFLLPVKSTYF